ncbi:MAG: aldo/keto reductase [Cyclobacteriaceae bacterium]
MKTLTFRNNDQMPAIGLGTWKAPEGEGYKALREAIRLGYRHIDCAHLYMNEKELGRALHDAMAEGDVSRKDLWITSKLWNNSHKKHQVKPALETTLADLQLDYIDLYLIHWPVVIKDDVVFPSGVEDLVSLDEVPLEETWAAMEDLADEGLARHIGVSNFSVKRLEQISKNARIKPEANQVEGHPYLQQNDLLDYCKANGIAVTHYSPFGSKDRPEHFKMGDEPELLEIPEIIALAEKHDCSPAQIILAWAVGRGASAIPKSVNPVRLKQNLEAYKIELSAQEIEDLKKVDKNYRFIVGKFWAVEGSPYTLEGLWG